MIAVIADDFTGAAELAGIALQYNLSVMLFTDDIVAHDAEVIIVSTNSRSLAKADAIEVTKKVTEALQKLNPTFIYKKVDSVLRGYVLDELEVQMSVSGLKRALLLPANPSLGRKIIGKSYFIDDVKISETHFASDPEFAIKDSSVKSMLNASENLALSINDKLPSQGVIVGEVARVEDINSWINKTDSSFLLAGAGDFFEELLKKTSAKKQSNSEVQFSNPFLYVCGTSFGKSTAIVKNIAQEKGGVHYLSNALMNGNPDGRWFVEVTTSLQRYQKAVIAIDEEPRQATSVSALALRNAMAKAVAEVVENSNVKEIFIEGGSTAASILEELKLQNFIPKHQLSRGVIRMKAIEKELFITVKPGSYQLPTPISELFLK